MLQNNSEINIVVFTPLNVSWYLSELTNWSHNVLMVKNERHSTQYALKYIIYDPFWSTFQSLYCQFFWSNGGILTLPLCHWLISRWCHLLHTFTLLLSVSSVLFHLFQTKTFPFRFPLTPLVSLLTHLINNKTSHLIFLTCIYPCFFIDLFVGWILKTVWLFI